MAIIAWPDDIDGRRAILCAVCKRRRHAAEVTAGWRDAQGCQAFACNEHFRASEQFIAGWTDFVAAARWASLFDGAGGYAFNLC
jgi:hypothetical protein